MIKKKKDESNMSTESEAQNRNSYHEKPKPGHFPVDEMGAQDLFRTATWQPKNQSDETKIKFALDELIFDLGVKQPAQGAYILAFDRLHEIVVDARTRGAASQIREALFRLSPNAPAAVALRRCLLGPNGWSLEDEAAAIGGTKQAIEKAGKKLARTFRLPPA